MKKRYLTPILLVSLMIDFAYCQESQIAGVPNVQWQMTPDQVQQVAPGQIAGEMLIYQQQFLTYPVTAQYFFADQQLQYVNMLPAYKYQDTAKWQPEYQQINRFLTEQYGQPTDQQRNMVIYRPEQYSTQATTVLYSQGWSVRYECYQPQQQ